MPLISRQTTAAFVQRFPFVIQSAYYLYRFFQPKYTLGVVGVVFNAQGHVLLVEHVYHPKLAWGLPGGWVGFNEDPGAAVTRELHEELGLIVVIGQLLRVERTRYHHVDIAFLCQSQNQVNTLSSELLAYRFCPIADLPRLHKFHYQAVMQAAKHLEIK